MFPKYSFVLPAYKATFLRESIDSILNQTYNDFELIIVNDASPEDLTSIVNSYDDERIQYYINEKNIGGTDLVAQWNHCIEYAKGEYLILASDDDLYHSDYLEKMDVLVGKYPHVNVFRSRVQHMNADRSITGESELLDEYLSYVDYLYVRCKGDVSSGLQYHIFKREELISIGGFVNFPSAWTSDDATVIKLAKNGVVSHNKALFAFRTSGLNISSKINDPKMLRDKLIAIDKYYRWYRQVLHELELVEKDKIENLSLMFSSISRKVMLNHMALLIKSSNRRAILSSWSILHQIGSLNVSDRIIICLKVLRITGQNKLRYFKSIFNRR